MMNELIVIYLRIYFGSCEFEWKYLAEKFHFFRIIFVQEIEEISIIRKSVNLFQKTFSSISKLSILNDNREEKIDWMSTFIL